MLFKTRVGNQKTAMNMNLPIKHIFPVLCCLFPLLASSQSVQPDTTIGADQNVSVLFGAQSKDLVTSSISRVTGATMRKSHAATIGNTLFGRLTGLGVMQGTTTPGFDDAALSIRGRHTFQNNGYLVLLDGFPINKFSQLSVDEIETVSILKDAASLALYGIKAANGAVLITTKRGKPGSKLNITFNARYGYQTPAGKYPSMANSYDFARLYNEALQNDGLPPLYSQKDLDGYRQGTDPYMYPNVNWYDEMLKKGSGLQDYTLSFNGGNSTAKYFLMLGYMDNKGIYAHTDQEHNANIGYKQINFRANVDLNLTQRISAQIGLGGDIEDRKFPPVSTESMWQNMATYAPNLYPVKTPDGQITGSASFPNNPLGDLLSKGYQSRHDRTVQAHVRLNYKLDMITEGLNLFGTAFFNSEFNSRYDKTRTNAYYEPIRTVSSAGEDSLYFLMRGTGTDLTVNTGSNVENNRMTFQAGFDYKRQFNNHGITALLMYYQDKYANLGDQAAYAMQNMAGRINWNLKQQYIAELSFSYSGTDNYAPGKRFGFFPAISAGWLIHKAHFWKENPVVNYLKLRASAGLLGNDRLPSALGRFAYNQYWGTASSQGYYFGAGQTFYNALIQMRIANPNLGWEKAAMYNAGIESKLFRNKLHVTVDGFYENRTGILVDMASVTPALGGVSSNMFENRGRVVNYGIEAELMYNDKAGNVNYFAGGQFSFARNIIKENYETPRKESYGSRKNQMVSQYFGLEAIGYFRDESDILSSPVQTFSAVRPGDLKYKDMNNDGVIDVNDEKAIGRGSYPEINFSFTGGASYKGFDLDFLFQGTGNRSVNMNNYLFQPFVNNNNISYWAANGHWTPATHATATFPRLTTRSSPNNYRSSTYWIRNVNMLRLRNVELGYTIPESSFGRMPIRSLRIYVSGLNLLSWDNLDPDMDTETMGLSYPALKVYTLGLNMKF
jgi:TonB-linked SusC/RagA family outer membrane protein